MAYVPPGVAQPFDATPIYIPPPPPSGPPTLLSIDPNNGTTDGGTISTILGTNLGATSAVYYGSELGTIYSVNSNISVTVISPPSFGGDPGNVNVFLMAGIASNPVQFDYQ
jgi:IPT/TIG domain